MLSHAESRSYLDFRPTNETKILVAEDDDAMREWISRLLRDEGYRVIEVEDGMELEDYLQSVADGEAFAKPDVIVSEAKLPGPGGLEVLAAMRAHDTHIPFILINSCGDLDTELEAVRLGADYVFDKPVDIEELRDALNRLAA